MNYCASQRPLCYGVAFNFDDGACWFKNDTYTYNVSPQGASSSNDTHLAVPASNNELDSYDTSCPFTNGTTQEQNGLNFTIHCRQDILGGDYAADGVLNQVAFHAESLQDCMNQCSTAMPKCQAVAFNPDMQNGWSNCYPKNNVGGGFVAVGRNIGNGAITHSAEAQLPSLTYNCTDNRIVDGNGTQYTELCNQDVPGNDLTQHFAETLEECAASCSEYSGDGSCIVAVFDTYLTNGFRNCYLKSAFGTTVNQNKQGFIVAQKGNTASTTSSTSSSPGSTGTGGSNSGTSDNNSSSLSGGAIAGIVIGAIAGLALIAALVFFLLRRRRNDRRQSQGASLAGAGAGSDTQPFQNSHSHAGYGQIDHKVAPPNAYQNTLSEAGWQEGQYVPSSIQKPYPGHGHGEQYEMESQDRTELPGAQVTPRAELPGTNVTAK